MIQWQFILRLPKNWSQCVDRNYKIFSLLFKKLYHSPTIPLALQLIEINHVITRLTHNSFRDWVRRLRMMHQPRSQALSRLCLPCPPNNKVMGRMGKGEKAWKRCWWYTSVLAWLSQTSLGLFCSYEINITFSINFYYIYACYRPRGWHIDVRMWLFKSSSCIMARDCRATSQLLQGLAWLETTRGVQQKNKQQKQWTLALKQKGCDSTLTNEI